MIRTRDVVVFVGALLVVLFGIALTLVFDARSSLNERSFITYFEVGTTSEYTAYAPEDMLDRSSIIERLRSALGSLQREVEPEPSVEESPSRASDEPLERPESPYGVLACGGDDTQHVALRWPASNVEIRTLGAFRSFVHMQTQALPVSTLATTSSSSTLPRIETSLQEETLISFLAAPSIHATASCVPGDIVGVTVVGTLMRNADASFYKGYGAEYLIGYARDGFPIYGYYQGAVDACGGYNHASGYRYTVTSDRPYLVGCFMGTPSSFSL
jgi:hypothetical protein